MSRLQSTLLAMALCASGTRALLAAPALTTIQDTLYKADGTRFEGIAFVQWKSFLAADTSSIPMQSVTVRINNGVLRVQLVPTTTASQGAYYLVRYNSSGSVQFNEYWSVPPSSAVLKLKDVRTANPLAGNLLPPPGGITAPVAVADVTGLREELDARTVKATGYVANRVAMVNGNGELESVVGSAPDCVRVDGSSGPCGTAAAGTTPTFVDSETPSGTIDGSNRTFSLSAAPNPVSSVALYRNGILQKQPGDYNITGGTITFAIVSAPRPGDAIVIWYRTGAALTGFADGETPAGTINGVNPTFTLAAAPGPSASLQVFRNGILQKSSVDYTVTGSTLTFLSGSVPQSGDTMQVWYRK